MEKQTVLVSACLLGVCCRYDGTGTLCEELEKRRAQYHFVPVCPEIYGGLPTPREPAERKNGKVLTVSGTDVTVQYQRGAQEIGKLAKLYDCKFAVLKERSPSCGHGKIYDGNFTHTVIDGSGVTAKLLEQNGIQVIGESQITLYL